MTEDAFLEKLFRRLPPPPPELAIPPGDDCAAIQLGDGRLLLIAVDQVIGDRHYRAHGAGAATPPQVGRKLLARNLSDIAAMGGVPRYALVATALDPQADEAWLTGFFDGVLALAGEFGVQLIGGDLARAPHDNVTSLTIVGEAADGRVCRRAGARPGDLFFATGEFGASLPTGHHLSFVPRCAEGRWLADGGFAHAMMDVSDGLLIDAGRLCRASGVSLALDTAAVPRRTPETTLTQALTDGEDYELIFAVPRERRAPLESAWPFAHTRLTCLGEFRPAGPAPVLDLAGRALSTGRHDGFDHFATA